MKFIGLSKGGLQVLEDIDPNKFRDIKSDFSWIDADKVDTQAMILLKDLYGISSLGNFTTPTIVAQDDYTLIVISYYFELGQRFLPVIVSDKRLMTIHPGLDPVCSEVMASINEMLVSGEFNASTILRGLFAAVIKRDTEHLQAMQNSLRNTELMMRGGVSNVAHIPKFIKESRGVSGSLQETREQIATIALGIADIPGIDEKEVFFDVYNSANSLSGLASEFSQVAAAYESELLLEMWDQLGKTRSITLTLSVFSIFVAAGAMFPLFYKDQLFGLDPLYISAGFVALGAIIGVISSLFKIKFKLS